MNGARITEIALLLQELRYRQLRTEQYMGELKAAGEDLGIHETEMLEFYKAIAGRMMRPRASKLEFEERDRLTLPEHLIDLNADPFVPIGWQVEEHQKGEMFKWDASKVSLYLSEPQEKGEWIEGHNLREKLAGKPVYNANLLDYLLKNPHFIPKHWKGKYVYFWGTIYRYSSDGRGVRYLAGGEGGWRWGDSWLGRRWSDDSPAAERAS
jgi:hypothetical protein